jgi:hypothetical protein
MNRLLTILPRLLFALASALAVLAAAQSATGHPRLVRDATSPCPQSQPTAGNWRLIEERQFFLHRPPNSYTGLYRSQGIATDGHRWFFSWQYGLEIADESFHTVLRNSSFKPPRQVVPGIPASLFARGLDHIGDIDYYNGIIYASLDTTRGYNDGHVALFRASDLGFTGVVFKLSGSPQNPRKDVASWVAVDAKRNRGYGKEWQLGNTINVYDLSDWRFQRTLTLDRALKDIQGGKVHGDWLYMAADDTTQSVYRANLSSGHVEELFRLPTPSGHREVEGIAIRPTDSCDDGRIDLYVEMVVDPDRSGQDPTNRHVHVSLYHYADQSITAPSRARESAAGWRRTQRGPAGKRSGSRPAR